MTFNEIINEHGGYWNHQDLIDYYYLVNPYFPTKKMLKDFNKMSKSLFTNYPSGQKIISDLASKIYNVAESNVVVGNGASELISFLCNRLTGTTGLIYPSFNEYKDRVKNFIELKSLNYSAEDIIEFFKGKIKNFILVNPQMHTGLHIDENDIHKIINWCKKEDIFLVIDESFIDFSDESLAFDLSKIYDYKNLFIIKSLSKSFGVPGIRLGVLASSNENILSDIKRELPIWNISSFAQYFLEIILKYKSDFIKSLEKLKLERDRFKEELSKVSEFIVHDSRANYFMIDLKTMDSEIFCNEMFSCGIIIRDLKSRFGTNSIRVSIRDKKDNTKFIKIVNKLINT